MSTNTTLRETEIRPEHVMAGQAERYANDVKRLLKRRGEFIEVPCPACDTRDGQPAFTKYEIPFLLCRECATLYASPRPTPEILSEYYSTSENYEYWNKYIFPASENARRTKIFRPRAERIVSICDAHGIPRGTLLEVGSGFGTFCEEMRSLNRFARIIAVEPTPDLAETCRKRGLEVIEKRIEEVDTSKMAVDVIASFEVIEHLFAPKEFVANCHRLLPKGGLLVLSCPNGQGFEVSTLREVSTTVDTEHINLFNPRSLSGLLEQQGFQTLEVTTPGKLDAELVRTKVVAGEVSIDAQPFLKRVLIDEWDRLGPPFQSFLAENQLSSHMWIVARKR